MLLRDVEMLRLTQPLKYPPTAPCLPEMELQVLKGLPSLQRLPACLPWALCVYFPFTGPHYAHSSHRRTLSSSLAPPTYMWLSWRSTWLGKSAFLMWLLPHAATWRGEPEIFAGYPPPLSPLKVLWTTPIQGTFPEINIQIRTSI